MHRGFPLAIRHGLYALLAGITILLGLGGYLYLRRIHRYDRLIREAGRRHGVDTRLIAAVIWRESRFRADAVGRAGEVGLMQVTAAAGEEWARATGFPLFSPLDLFEPANNIQAGTWYLARALKRWSDRDDPLPFALAEYNAGRSNALRWDRKGGPSAEGFVEAITYPTTRRYILDIIDRYRGRRT